MKLRRVPRMLRSPVYLGTWSNEISKGTVRVERGPKWLEWIATVEYVDGVSYSLAFHGFAAVREYFKNWELWRER